jgi:hypothetical protein
MKKYYALKHTINLGNYESASLEYGEEGESLELIQANVHDVIDAWVKSTKGGGAPRPVSEPTPQLVPEVDKAETKSITQKELLEAAISYAKRNGNDALREQLEKNGYNNLKEVPNDELIPMYEVLTNG